MKFRNFLRPTTAVERHGSHNGHPLSDDRVRRMMASLVKRMDVASHDDGTLLEALRARSERLAAAALSLPLRVFRMASPQAPGVSFVGAEALHWDGVPVGAGGSGTTLVDALVSCIGELVERVSQVEQPSDIAGSARIDVITQNLPSGVASLVADVASAHDDKTPVDWVSARDLRIGEAVMLPADWCIRRRADGPLRMLGTALSTGVAAGATAEAATLRALLELVERDAAALWWVGGRRARPLDLEQHQAAAIETFVNEMREGARDRRHWLLDVSTDLNIPCVVAVSVDGSGKGLACGMAARLDAVDAARAALFEMFQMELALLMVELKRKQRGDAALNAVDRQHIARATDINATTCDLLHPTGQARAWLCFNLARQTIKRLR